MQPQYSFGRQWLHRQRYYQNYRTEATLCKCRYKTMWHHKNLTNMNNLCSCKSIHSRHITRKMIIHILPLEGWQHCRSAASTISWTLYKWLQLCLWINFKLRLDIQLNRYTPITGNKAVAQKWNIMHGQNPSTGHIKALIQGTFRAILQGTFSALLQCTFDALLQCTKWHYISTVHFISVSHYHYTNHFIPMPVDIAFFLQTLIEITYHYLF